MSLYNMLFGQNPMSGLLLSMVGLTPGAVGRLRDCYAERDETGWVICVYTRNGGGNREHWNDDKESGPDCDCTGCIITHRLPAHPQYIDDADDDFDCTYATIRFRAPEKFAEALEAIGTENATPAERWQRMFDKLNSGDKSDPEVANAIEAIRPVIEQIAAAVDPSKEQNP